MILDGEVQKEVCSHHGRAKRLMAQLLSAAEDELFDDGVEIDYEDENPKETETQTNHTVPMFPHPAERLITVLENMCQELEAIKDSLIRHETL